MNVMSNENLKMKESLSSLFRSVEAIKDKCDKEIVSKIEDLYKEQGNLYLADFAILDLYDLDKDILSNAEEMDELFMEKTGFSIKEGDETSKIRAMAQDWNPILCKKENHVQSTDFVYNTETSEITTIDDLTNTLQSIPFKVTVCTSKGKRGFSNETGPYYKEEPKFEDIEVYSSLDLKESLDNYLSMDPSLSFADKEQPEEEMETEI